MGNMRLEIRDAKRYPWKELMRFGKKRGVSPRFIGPSEILKRVRKYTIDAQHMLEYEQEDIQPGLTYKEQLVEITDRKDQVQRGKVAKLVRGLWKNERWKNPPGI
ncbi:hypothetical protein POM88_012596 [Heracleum sosnowskyi]|uniref:Uncharacterized protein n=1 Tax=Heracleum sosnowskyi TaxID=360622 RepID=A0AAD8MXG3_9APIA|nr:hypothetical protein POM88_012596 [Heracleum sosnowskyi]